MPATSSTSMIGQQQKPLVVILIQTVSASTQQLPHD